MRYAKEWGRRKILENNLQFKEGWMELIYTRHAMDRLRERLKGEVLIYPKNINISKLNINKGYSYDKEYLHKVIIRLEYKPDEWIYLVILPDKRLVKSLWFEKKAYGHHNTYQARIDSPTVGDVPKDMEGKRGASLPEL